ncbi:MAG: ArsI/CadI family heavy metal resistance metalloenzyme [Caulobacteraceae bacterium]
MKRFHVRVAVGDLDRSIGFYSTLFGAAPSVVKDDYAKWMLDDPRVNFAISNHRAQPGVEHLGVQAEDGAELAEIASRLKAAGAETFDETDVACCYARGDKTWVRDPSGVRWETFRTFGVSTAYGEDSAPAPTAAGASRQTCCA